MENIDIAVTCKECGRKMTRSIDPDCPSSTVRCVCGTRYPVRLENQEPRSDYGFGGDEQPDESSMSIHTGILK
ncbi:MAG: hypothetical protein ACLFWL_17350 [Candidatus Brocadiia bacterium]|nr:hypothetical protein [Planctomycetota bacterium]